MFSKELSQIEPPEAFFNRACSKSLHLSQAPVNYLL
jgi:hypothetical protein